MLNFSNPWHFQKKLLLESDKTIFLQFPHWVISTQIFSYLVSLRFLSAVCLQFYLPDAHTWPQNTHHSCKQLLMRYHKPMHLGLHQHISIVISNNKDKICPLDFPIWPLRCLVFHQLPKILVRPNYSKDRIFLKLTNYFYFSQQWQFMVEFSCKLKKNVFCEIIHYKVQNFQPDFTD